MSEHGEIRAYLERLRQDLPRGGERRRILAEVGAHLEDGAAAARAAGMRPSDAERRAVERFGPPGEVARTLAADLAADGARAAPGIAALALAGMVALWILMGQLGSMATSPGGDAVEGIARWATWAAFGLALAAIALSLALGRARRARPAVAAAGVAMAAIGVSTAACLLVALSGEYIGQGDITAIAVVRVALTVTAAALVARAALRVAGERRRTAC